jgi:excisionase family DNA binding protein
VSVQLTPDVLGDLAEQLAPLIAERLQAAPAELIDADEAGRLLGVPKSWPLAEARADRIPHVRIGRYVRFRRADLVAWAAARTRGPVRRTGTSPVSEGREAA